MTRINNAAASFSDTEKTKLGCSLKISRVRVAITVPNKARHVFMQVCALIGSAPVSRFARTRHSRAEKKHETRFSRTAR